MPRMRESDRVREVSRKRKSDQRTLRERGAAIAYVASVERLRKLRTETQRDLFVSRLELRREWQGIQNAALAALA